MVAVRLGSMAPREWAGGGAMVRGGWSFEVDGVFGCDLDEKRWLCGAVVG